MAGSDEEHLIHRHDLAQPGQNLWPQLRGIQPCMAALHDISDWRSTGLAAMQTVRLT
jgi:hypothetical protein